MNLKRLLTMVSVVLLLLSTGCAVNSTGPTDTGCAIAEIEWKITRKAELAAFKCQHSETTDPPAFLFAADVQNNTLKPLRYRLSVVIPDLKKAIGHLVPRKGVPPVVNPGETEQVTLVFQDTTQWPEKAEVTLIVLPEQPEPPAK